MRISHLAWIAAIVVLPLVLPLGIGIWLPDVFTGATHTLATTAADGYSFRAVQYWNHVDFYSTELHVTDPGGRTSVQTIDGDASKCWGPLSLSVDPPHRSVSVGGYAKQFAY